MRCSQAQGCASQEYITPAGLILADAPTNALPAQPVDPSATTEKYGLEAGLWKALTSRERRPTLPPARTRPRRCSKQYGSAYLLTSISFALVSFGACYLAVRRGVDVRRANARVGLAPDALRRVGTVAHRVRGAWRSPPSDFPPTVASPPWWRAGWKARQEGSGPCDAGHEGVVVEDARRRACSRMNVPQR